jgi:glycerol-3-phosphate dehydrogenase (NAD(P)+)
LATLQRTSSSGSTVAEADFGNWNLYHFDPKADPKLELIRQAGRNLEALSDVVAVFHDDEEIRTESLQGKVLGSFTAKGYRELELGDGDRLLMHDASGFQVVDFNGTEQLRLRASRGSGPYVFFALSADGKKVLSDTFGRSVTAPVGWANIAAATIALMAGAALLAGWAPLGFSIVTVFLFAGPHNWVELRYFLSRMPGRWGKLRGFFLFSFGGIFSLVAAFAALPWLGAAFAWSETDWGTALAVHLARRGHRVTLWGRDSVQIEEMRTRRANQTYLPDVAFPAGLIPEASMDAAVDGVRHAVFAVPSHGLRSVLRAAGQLLPEAAVIVSATKGLESDTLHRMSEIALEETDAHHPVVVLSGPSFAAEVARSLPTALVVASSNRAAVCRVQEDFAGPFLRLYGSDDVVGVEMGAALKNVMAIAAGMAESLGLGHNALAALITRGLAEMSRLVEAMGGQRETLAGLSGLGDLVLTCTGTLSRNRHVGVELGLGRSLPDILVGMRMVAEGVRTTDAALALAARHGIDLPIAGQMAAVLSGRKSPREAVAELMLRPQREEAE